MKKWVIFLVIFSQGVTAQETFTVSGIVQTQSEPLPFANVYIEGTSKGTTTNLNGVYTLNELLPRSYTLRVSHTGYRTQRKNFNILNKDLQFDFILTENDSLDEVVVSGTLKPVNRLESPVPVEIYRPTFFKKNPTPNVFEALQNV